MLILLARPEIASELQKRWAEDPDVRVFQDSDSLRAFKTIATLRPTIIALDPLFAGTGRGATLIARVKADETLAAADIRLLTIEGTGKSIELRDPAATPETVISCLSRQLDWCGTRRAARFPIGPEAPAVVNGEPGRLVNLSTTGVQIIFPSRLRPAQGFRLTLVNDELESRMQAVVAWSTLQGSGAAPSYRAGAEFVQSDRRAIEAYCERYGMDPDHLFVMRSGKRGRRRA
jgi:hypothetical protein